MGAAKAPQSKGFTNSGFPHVRDVRKLQHVARSRVPPQDFEVENPDMEIYRHANAVLDRGIRENHLEAALTQFRSMMAVVKSQCATRRSQCPWQRDKKPPVVVSECWMAWQGCGQPCLDELTVKHSWDRLHVGC